MRWDQTVNQSIDETLSYSQVLALIDAPTIYDEIIGFLGTPFDNVALLFEDTFYLSDEVYEGVAVALVREVSEPAHFAL